MSDANYLVAYFDVYAFSNMVREDSLASLSIRLTKTAKAIKERADENGLKLFVFSDCGFLLCEMPTSSSLERDNLIRRFIHQIEILCDDFLEQDMLVRGGVAYGQVFIDDSIIVGPPIIEAVRLEGAIPAPFILFPLKVAKELNVESYIPIFLLTLKQGNIIRAGLIYPTDTANYRLLLEKLTKESICRGDPVAAKSQHALDMVNHILKRSLKE
ncbi:MAG: hypothetical protein KKF43_02355 [Proteobacteria bacterium]|nr:hypothetical protein [Pseudomonadota bacterium]